jgi:hypothetical protein
MADNSLTDISGVGPKTADSLREQGIDSKDELLRRYRADDPAGGMTVDLDLDRRVRRGIREELVDRGERFEDPEANVEVGPENRKAFEVFGQTTVSDLDSVDTRYGPASAGTSLAELAPKAASGELGQRGYGGQSITDFAADAAANLGLTDMSGAAVQEMNARGTNPTAARLGAPRPDDPYGVSVADEPPADLTNPERLEPGEPSVRVRDEPGEKRRAEFTKREAMAAQKAFEYRETLGIGDDLNQDDVENTFFTIRDERDDDGTVELTPTQATTLSTVVSGAAQSERYTERSRVQRGTEDIEGAERIAAAADPTTDADADRASPILAARFDAEPAVSLVNTDQSGGDGDAGGGSESEMQFDATPAVQLSDRGTSGGGLFIGPRGTEEIDPGVGGFSVADDNNTSTRLRDDKGREVTITRRETGLHNRRKSFGVSMQKEKGRSLGNETVSERISFGSYADQGVEGAADEVESIIERMGASRFAMNASERQMQFDAEPAVSLFDTDQSGDDGDAGDPLLAGEPEFQGPTSRRPIPESELQDPDSLGGVFGRSLQGTGLAPSDPEFSELDERQSRRRQTGDRPDDLAEQLAAQRAAPTVTRPDADPAVQLTDTDRLQDSQENGTVALEGQTQSVADTAVGYAENKGLVDRGLRDRVNSGELSPEEAEQTEMALRRFGEQKQTLADEGRTTIMGSPENHAQWAEWAREAREDLGSYGGSAGAQASDDSGRFGAGGSSAEPAVSLFDTSSGGEQPEPAPTGAESLEDPDLIRLRSSGRFNRDPTVDEPAAPGQRAPANGRFVGDSDNITRPADPEEPIMRDPDTGQFVVTDR